MHPNTAALVQINPDGAAWLEWSTAEPAIALDREAADAIASRGQLASDVMQYLPDSGRIHDDSDPRTSGYHAATKDHPFLDMSRGMEARVEDAKIMAGYVEADDYPSVYLRLPHAALHPLERGSDLNLDALRNSDTHQLAAILAGVFGQTHRQPSYHDHETGYHQVELIFRSVPSGGARHPTECLIEVLRSPSLHPGRYYFDTQANALALVQSGPAHHRVDAELDSDADWILDIRLVSIVRRAMFRYRDPRSFRALLVDAGHADAQLHAFAAFCNWRYRSAVDIDFHYATDSFGMAPGEAPVLVRGRLEGWR